MNIIRAKSNHLDDLTPLFDLYRQFYEQKSDLVACKKFLKQRLENNETIVFMAYEGEQALGFVHIFPIWSSVSLMDDYILNDLYVAKDFRRQGIGSALLNAAKEEIVNLSGKGLHLETAVDNPAQILYEKEGWKQQNQGTLFYEWKVN